MKRHRLFVLRCLINTKQLIVIKVQSFDFWVQESIYLTTSILSGQGIMGCLAMGPKQKSFIFIVSLWLWMINTWLSVRRISTIEAYSVRETLNWPWLFRIQMLMFNKVQLEVEKYLTLDTESSLNFLGCLRSNAKTWIRTGISSYRFQKKTLRFTVKFLDAIRIIRWHNIVMWNKLRKKQVNRVIRMRSRNCMGFMCNGQGNF